FEVQLLLDVVRQRKRRFDHLAVEVEQVNRPVRPETDVNWAEPRVRGREKLAIFVGAHSFEDRAIFLQEFAVNDVVRWVADEVVAVELLRKQLASVDQRATARREVAAGDKFR